jgi:hypothetical protein
MFPVRRQRTILGVLALGLLAPAAGFVNHLATAGPVPRKQGQAKLPAADRKAPRPPGRDMELAKALGTPIDFKGFDDPKTVLAEALDALAKIYNVTFDVNEKAFARDGVKEVLKEQVTMAAPIPEMRAPLGHVLRKVLARVSTESGATWMIRKEGFIEVTTHKAVREELGLAEGAALQPLVYEEFEDQPLSAALQALTDATGWSVVLDAAAVDEYGMMVTARLYNVPVDTAARTLAALTDLAVVRMENVLLVTSRAKAARLQAEQVPAVGASRAGAAPADAQPVKAAKQAP